MSLSDLAATPHRRYNPLLDEWVLCSPHRLARPWQGQIEPVRSAPAAPYDASCYLCPGNPRAGGARNPHYAHTFAFDNDFPALLRDGGATLVDDHGLLVAESETGICRVLCHSPRHDLTLARMSVDEIAHVVTAWCDETQAIGEQQNVAWVQLFENNGAMMGASNPHPHSQLWGVRTLPTLPARKLVALRAYRDANDRDLLGDYLELEVHRGERLVCANDHWVAVVPFWAAWPFQLLLLPRRDVGQLSQLEPHERDALADIVRRLHVRLDNLFRTSMPYSMAWFGAPRDGGDHPWWRLHAEYYPPLLRSADVRKFLVGYELAAEPQRDLTAEQAAERLRAQSDVHYTDGRTA